MYKRKHNGITLGSFTTPRRFKFGTRRELARLAEEAYQARRRAEAEKKKSEVKPVDSKTLTTVGNRAGKSSLLTLVAAAVLGLSS